MELDRDLNRLKKVQRFIVKLEKTFKITLAIELTFKIDDQIIHFKKWQFIGQFTSERAAV